MNNLERSGPRVMVILCHNLTTKSRKLLCTCQIIEHYHPAEVDQIKGAMHYSTEYYQKLVLGKQSTVPLNPFRKGAVCRDGVTANSLPGFNFR